MLLLYNYRSLTAANHTGLDIRFWATLSFIFGTAILLTSMLKPNLIGKTDKLTIAIFIVAVLTSINVFAFDYFNVFVEYETWLKRGMPDKPFYLDI